MSDSALLRFLLPPGTQSTARLVLIVRGLRAFGDGYVSLLLPFYLTLLGFSALEVGALVTSTLLGSGLMTLAVGYVAHRYHSRSLLLAASLLMAATGGAFVLTTDFWPLMVIAAAGTLNPSSGDVSVFLPIEHTLLSHAAAPQSRTALFARYSLIGALVAAVGAQAAGLPTLMEASLSVPLVTGMKAMFVLYGAIGLVGFVIYRQLSPRIEVEPEYVPTPLGKSKTTVYKLAALFSLDAFAGGFAVQSLLALWLYQRFDLSLAAAGTIFFWVGILAAASQLASPWVAARIGLVNTMVFTHLPANVFLVMVPLMPTLGLALAFLYLRAALSSMDVPARTSYVMAVVSPGERPAAASVTAVPRSLAAALSPALAGYLLSLSTFGWPLIICGTLKIVYDLTLLRLFSRVKPPEELKRP